MGFLIGSTTSTTGLDRPTARIPLSAVWTGTLLAIACTAAAFFVGAAVSVRAAENGYSLGPWSGRAWVIGIGASIAFGAFVGGRFAAVNARAVVRRDGLLGGLFTWALVMLIAGVSLVVWYAVKRPPWPELPVLRAFLWNTVFIGLATLLAALVGGMRGARAEARAIGLRAVRPPTFTPYRDTMDLEAYEHSFFAEPPEPPSAGASLQT
jgi:hypothetical protein